jgi:hypothetical protein
LVLTLIGLGRNGVQVEIDRFFQYLAKDKTSVQSFTKSAFTQARQKLKSKAFLYLNKKQLAYFDEHAPNKAHWHGHRIVAIDGSTLNLPDAACLKAHFGVFGNQQEKKAVGAKISIAYDVCNHLILDAEITKTKGDEKEQARGHLSKLNPQTDILVFDRGYPSYLFFDRLQKEGFKFCFRLSSGWREAYRLLADQNDVSWTVPKGYRVKDGSEKEIPLKEAIVGLRLVKIPLTNGDYEVLVTNLTDTGHYTLAVLKELYHLRWTIEECYKRMKQVTQMEYFSGRTVRAIEQDFYARIVMLNMMAMMETQSLQPELQKAKTNRQKHAMQINRVQAMAKLKDSFLAIAYGTNIKLTIEKMLKVAVKCYDIVRPERHFKRNKCYRYKRKPLMYKAF